MPITLSNQELALIEQAFTMARSEELFAQPTLFYEKLFERDPNLRALFREDIAGQGMRFMRTLRTIVTALRQLGGAQEVLEPLARTHGALGVHAQHFETMGEALIDTFKELLGPDFTPEMEAAWRKAYREIADAMIEAGKID
ncbi:globin domain-containing protein [Jhaorihella thermophila]|uniref:Nitric oxide dioxygenase n=1 Tax=Jhaorihella thermophila TaxID=488547 RepID=A0A1H5TK81_9RHOB|nr:globin domain-containing protein [Jhaorihella thermophila]SEF62491.1 nitric oxide dioxygenase [Jhaorihella thermophila]